MNHLLTKKQKALELGISEKTLDRRSKRGEIKYVQVPPNLNRSNNKWYFPEDTENLQFLTNYYLGKEVSK